MGKQPVIKPEECLGGRLGIWLGYKITISTTFLLTRDFSLLTELDSKQLCSD